MLEKPGAPRQEPLLTRMRAEYLEMPGLRLTFAQAQRLWGLDATTCAELLAALVADQFLCHGPDGAYGRATEGLGPSRPFEWPRWRRLSMTRVLQGRARPSRELERVSDPRGSAQLQCAGRDLRGT